MALSRAPKFLPPDGSVPKEAKFVCKGCNEWFASGCGKTGHIKKNPTHTLYSPITGREWQGSTIGTADKGNRLVKTHLAMSNGNGHIAPAILEYAFERMRSEIDKQLDSLHEQLIPTQSKGARRTYVAR